MNRRKFVIAAVSIFVCVPPSVEAQPARKVRRIGWLANWPPLDPGDFREHTQHLRALGWTDGQNLIIEQRYTGGKTDLLPALVESLLRLNVEMIVAEGTVVAIAAKKVTKQVPIVVARSGDPVAAGLVETLARPGTNITGTSVVSPALEGKRFEILHELLPTAKRVGMVIVPANPIDRATRDDREVAASLTALGLQPVFVEVGESSQLESSIAEAARRGAQVLRISAEPLLGQNFDRIVRAARHYSLPIVADNSGFLESGALASYGPDIDDLDRQLAFCIDKILRGAKPADVPIQQPRKFELGINLPVADSFGISVSPSLLQRADVLVR